MNTAIVMPCLINEYEDGRLHMQMAAHKAGLDVRDHIEIDYNRVGFFRAVNKGIATVRDLFNLDYVCLLNADACPVQPGWLARMIEVAESDAQIGLVGPSIPCGSAPQKNGKPGMPAGVEDVVHLNFSCTLVRDVVFEQIGLFDERYIHYGGDYAFLHEAQAQGWRSVWVRDVWVWHEWHGNRFPEWVKPDRDLFYSEWNRNGTRKC